MTSNGQTEPAARRLLRLAALAGLLIARAAAAAPPSARLNERLPKWLSFGGDYRARFEGFAGGAFRPRNDDTYLLSRVRLNMTLKPAEKLRLELQAQDARAFWRREGAYPPYQDTLDLRLAYIQLGPEKPGLMARVGRQELAFGAERILGNTNWGNGARSFDGLRAAGLAGPFRVDAFGASLVRAVDDRLNEANPGEWLYGVYAASEELVKDAKIEPYALGSRIPGRTAESGRVGALEFASFGLRWVGNLPTGFDYDTEMLGQAGSLRGEPLLAWAGHWAAGYKVRGLWTPRLVLEYNYASGDGDPRDGKISTFQPLYPTPHDKYGMADQVGWRNMHNPRASAEFAVRPGVTVIGRYQAWWLASKRDWLYNGGATASPFLRSPDGSAGRFVGQELDLIVNWAFAPRALFSAGYGHIVPGTFLKNTTGGAAHHSFYTLISFAL